MVTYVRPKRREKGKERDRCLCDMTEVVKQFRSLPFLGGQKFDLSVFKGKEMIDLGFE